MSALQSFDEQAAAVAERMLAKSLPDKRGGNDGAEGGFTTAAGGQVLDAAAKSDDDDEDDLGKAGKTGSAITSEPGHEGPAGRTGSAVSSQPGHSEGGGAGEGGNVDQDDDEMARKRKPGKVGISKAAVSDPDEEEMGDEEDDDEDETEKSLIGADDLMKSLDTLEAVAEGASFALPAARREELAEKLADGTLSKSEMRELGSLMKSDDDDEFEDSFVKSFSEDPEMAEGYDASSFLERQSQLLAAGLDAVQSRLSKSLAEQSDRARSFNTQLAKSLRGMAQVVMSQDAMIKSLVDRIEGVEQQPVPRRGVTSMAQLLRKGISGEVGYSDPSQLSKSQVGDALERMAMAGIDHTKSGHRIDHAIALIEQNGTIAKSLYTDVQSYLESQGNGNNGVR